MSRKAMNVQTRQKPAMSWTPMSTTSTDSPKSQTLPQLSNSKSGSLFDEYDDDDSESSSHDKVKTMFMSIWNNVKFGFATKLKTKFSYESPIWLLGQCYHKRLNDSHSESYRLDDTHHKVSAIDKFKHDFYSRIWLTYRREFPKLANSQLTSDCGWGCMLRSGQMILAQAFLTHYLSRQWRWSGPQSDKEDMIHRMIIKWFADDPSGSCSPFSVHQLVKFGEQMGKKPGDWFGPASVAHLIRCALTNASISNPVLSNICCYVAQDCTVFIQDVINLCVASNPTSSQKSCNSEQKRNSLLNDNRRQNSVSSSNNEFDIEMGVIENEDSYCEAKNVDNVMLSIPSPSLLNYGKAPSTFNLTETTYTNSGPRSLPFSLAHGSECNSSSKNKWRGVIILVPVRLGSERLNPIYIPCVRQLLAHPSCLGIIGGKPKHSLYFIGWQDDKLIYIDPHYCQQSIDVRQINFPLDSFHCDFPRKTHFSYMDPSCAIGFYCQTRQDFYDFIGSMKELLIPPNQSAEYPIFVFNDGTNMSNANTDVGDRQDKLLRVKHRFVNSEGKVEKEVHTEEFVML